MTSGWGGVLHYPEFVKHMDEIGTYQDDVDELNHGKEDKRFNIDSKNTIFGTIKALRKYLDYRRSSTDRRRMMMMMNIMKRSFSTSQLRKQ